MIWIKDATIPELNRREDVLIEGQKISLVGREKIETYFKQFEGTKKTIDANGKYLLPSFSDSHFHLRNPGFEYKQTYEEANNACMKGGYTDVIAMANTKPVADNEIILQEVANRTKHLPLHVYQIASVTKGLQGKELVDFSKLMKWTDIFSDDGKNIDCAEVMKHALMKSKDLGFLIMDHSEPETEMVIRNIKLVEEVGGNLHFCHISRRKSVEAIVRAKEKGLNVTFEVTPHHLFSHDLNYRVNPPIATKEDSKALVWAIQQGYVDYIGTDHAPHSEEDKQKGAPGIINIENTFSMIRKVFYENNIDWNTLVNLMAKRPATLFGKTKGICEGTIADLILVSDKETTICTQDFVTRSKNTPYEGWEVRGKVELTIVKGEIIYGNGHFAK